MSRLLDRVLICKMAHLIAFHHIPKRPAWRDLLPDARAQHYVFPSERYGSAGDEGQHTGKAVPYAVDPTRPIGSWKVAWQRAKQQAVMDCRWHDLRHTLVSRLAEGQASDATIMELAGHLSWRMMQRYSHVGNERKQEAMHNLALG